MKRGARRALTGSLHRLVCVSAVSLLLGACASESEPLPPPPPPPPTRLEATIEASTYINRDIRNRPSPVVTRLYELESETNFINADFFDLYDEQDATLLGMIVRHDEFAVMPLDKLTVERQLQPSTRFIGVIAAYREIDRAMWRDIIPIEPNQTNRFVVHLLADGIAIKPADEQGGRSSKGTGQPIALTSLYASSSYDKSGEADVLE